MKPVPFDYVACADIAQALAALTVSGGMARPCSGTQSLGPMLNLRFAQPSQLLDVSRIPALRACVSKGDVLSIGAAVTHAQLEDGAVPDVTGGLLPTVAAGIAYRAVRNRGTLGGSLAHADPCADWVTTMRLLDAAMLIAGPRGERRVAASRFFEGPFTTTLEPEELLVAVDVPCFSPQARWAYRKACRKPGEFAESIAAAWVDPVRGVARLVVGALSGPPQAVDGADALNELRDAGSCRRLLDGFGVDDPYERQLHTIMIRRALDDLDRVRA